MKQEFKKLYPYFMDNELALYFSISADTVKNMAAEYNLQKTEGFIAIAIISGYTKAADKPMQEDIPYVSPVKKNMPKPSDMPAPPPPKVKSKQKPNSWTIDDDDLLRAEYPCTPSGELAKQLGRSQRAVEVRASSAGIKKMSKQIASKSDAIKAAKPEPEPEPEIVEEQEIDDTDDDSGNIAAVLGLDEKKLQQAKAKRVLKAAKIQTSEKIPVRIDAKTTIFITPGTDPEAAKAEYFKKHKNKPISK